MKIQKLAAAIQRDLLSTKPAKTEAPILNFNRRLALSKHKDLGKRTCVNRIHRLGR